MEAKYNYSPRNGNKQARVRDKILGNDNNKPTLSLTKITCKGTE
jgi:hypothetical protein